LRAGAFAATSATVAKLGGWRGEMPPVKPVSGETHDDERARREREGRLVRRVLTAVSIALTPALGEAIDAPTGPGDGLSFRSEVLLWIDGVKKKLRLG
jgi:hypothetical protein